jgi:hypothetical protein
MTINQAPPNYQATTAGIVIPTVYEMPALTGTPSEPGGQPTPIAAGGGSIINDGNVSLYFSTGPNPLDPNTITIAPGGSLPWPVNVPCWGWSLAGSAQSGSCIVMPIQLPYSPGGSGVQPTVVGKYTLTGAGNFGFTTAEIPPGALALLVIAGPSGGDITDFTIEGSVSGGVYAADSYVYLQYPLWIPFNSSLDPEAIISGKTGGTTQLTVYAVYTPIDSLSSIFPVGVPQVNVFPPYATLVGGQQNFGGLPNAAALQLDAEGELYTDGPDLFKYIGGAGTMLNVAPTGYLYKLYGFDCVGGGDGPAYYYLSDGGVNVFCCGDISGIINQMYAKDHVNLNKALTPGPVIISVLGPAPNISTLRYRLVSDFS